MCGRCARPTWTRSSGSSAAPTRRPGHVARSVVGRVILALESSCDETAAAVAHGGRLLSSVVASQAELHAPYGGVVPEVASRRHLELCVPVIERALAEAGVSLDEVD